MHSLSRRLAALLVPVTVLLAGCGSDDGAGVRQIGEDGGSVSGSHTGSGSQTGSGSHTGTGSVTGSATTP